MHNWVNKQLKVYGAYIDDFFYAPYYEFSKKKEYKKNKFLRKPNIGMFVKAKNKWDINIKNSYVVGDKPSDMLFARNSNLKGILINKDDNLYTKVIKVIKNDVF